MKCALATFDVRYRDVAHVKRRKIWGAATAKRKMPSDCPRYPNPGIIYMVVPPQLNRDVPIVAVVAGATQLGLHPTMCG